MLIGHEKQRELLDRIVVSKKIPHGIIFQGRSSLGKKKIAIDLFKKINCGCDNCKRCLSIENNKDPDLILIEPVKGVIQIDQIRNLIKKVSLSPHSSCFKWVIIDDAHLLNREAANALLKILEEPKGETVFFLITEYPEMLLATIRSRLQRFKFFPVEKDKIKNLLIEKGIDEEKADEISLFSFGRPGIAVNFSKNPEDLKFRKKTIKELAKITSIKESFHLRFDYAKKISEDKDELRRVLEIWLSYFRELFIRKVKGENVSYSLKKIIRSINSINKTIDFINQTNINAKLAIESLLIEL